MIGTSLIFMALFKYAVGECVLDPAKNKYQVLARNEQAYILQPLAYPDIRIEMPKAVVEKDGKKVSCK